MLSRKQEYQCFEAGKIWDVESMAETDNSVADSLNRFYGKFTDYMEMSASAQTVADYLNTHRGWFCRCASPMKVEPIGENGYALTIGRFGSFGYEVEPKIGLELLPPDQGIYHIKTLPVPDYVAPGYEVEFEAVMELVESTSSSQDSGKITRVEWQLELAVHIQFPKFIQRLPKSMLQSTGDRLLNQIVRQVSRRLTSKVQEDFHNSLGLAFPPKSKKRSEKV
jgi:hypothetical protein